jgi:hypothetical protein
MCSKTPVEVDIGEVSTLATGEGFANVLAVLRNGELMTWGSGESGDLGNGEAEIPLGIPTPAHVCAAYASGPCTHGPYLTGEILAMAVGGNHDLVYARQSGQ